jgi:hypothetical protein
MIDELDEARHLFRRADDALERVLFEVGMHVGITPGQVQEEVRRLGRAAGQQ